MAFDQFEGVDYYNIDDLLTTEQKLVRDTVRQFVKQEVSPIIEDYAQRAETPRELIPGLAEIGAFGPTIPVDWTMSATD